MTKRVTLKEMRSCVQQGIEFRGTNDSPWDKPSVWGENREYGPYTNAKPLERCYCVFSYRYSWPILVFSDLTGKWYGNDDYVSSATSRHLRMCKPEGVEINWVGQIALTELANNGTSGAVRQMVKAA